MDSHTLIPTDNLVTMQAQDPKKQSEQVRFDIALFPIPELVAFPGATVPLHVFEPRYRRLVDDCINEHRLIGLCHTVKEISSARKNQTLEEALQSNQATYQPHEIFSAGFGNIIEVTSDGRLQLTVKITGRFRFLEELQTLPYRIARCEAFVDNEDSPDQYSTNSALQQQINGQVLKLIVNQDPSLAPKINWSQWKDLDPADYSFRIFDFLRFEADLMQTILQSRSANERLAMIWRILDQAMTEK